MTAASVEEEEDMDLSEEGEVAAAREDDGADEELQPPGEDLNGKQAGGGGGGGGKKRKKQSSGQMRDEGEEWAQKAQVRVWLAWILFLGKVALFNLSLPWISWNLILQVWKNELDSVRAEWQEDVEDKEKKIKLLQTAMQVGNFPKGINAIFQTFRKASMRYFKLC